MNKTAKIFLSSIMLYLVGIVSCMYFYFPKQKQIATPVIEVSKTIHTQNKQSEKQIQSLLNEKVLLQKNLLQTKTTLNKQNEKVIRLEQSVSSLSEKILCDNSKANSNCIELSYNVDSLITAYQVKDSITHIQFVYTDSLLCNQDITIARLQTSNTFLKNSIDTLIEFQLVLQKQNKKYQRKLAIKSIGNRFMASGILACTSVITYLQIKSN